MASTSRTPYNASTPDRTTFEGAAEAIRHSPPPQVTFIATPADRPRVSRSGHAGPRTLRRVREVAQANLGLLLVASSQLFFSLMNVCVKKLNSLDPPVPAVELILVRMIITWICCVTYMSVMKVPNPILGPENVRHLLVQRGVFGFMGIFGLYYSLQYLSLSDATVLQFLSPVFTAIGAAVFLHEAFSPREAAAGMASLVGVVLIARPAFLFGVNRPDIPIPPDAGDLMLRAAAAEDGAPSDTVTGLVAVGVALVGAVGAAGAYTTIRCIGKRAHALHNLVGYSTLCVLVTAFAMPILRIPFVVPWKLEWLAMLLLIGIFGFGGQVLLTMGLQRETAGRGVIAVYGQIVFATALELVVFHTAPPALSVLGTVIIVGSALYVALTKTANKAPVAVAVPADDPSVEEGLLAGDFEDNTHR